MNQEIALTAPATTARQERTSTTLPAQRVSTAAQTAIINIDNVVKTYESGSQQVRALKGVSLSVERGESGLDVVDGGRITIAGADLAELSDKTRTTFRARNMGFVFQTYNLLPVLSAVENVELPLIVSGVNPREARQRALQALETVSLRQLANNRPAQLSGGQRQRVTIARSLVNEPDIVWADEPTGALDSKTADDIMQLMETLNREKGLTFVIVTHDPAIGARCNRVVRMRDGVIVSEESRK
jgi:putative ABC transport system ATP-binding protein